MKYNLLIAAVAAIKLNDEDIVSGGADNMGSNPSQPFYELDASYGLNATTHHIPWDPTTLPECPDDFEQKFLVDGYTPIVRYPHVGANCIGSPWPEPLGTEAAQKAPAL